MQDFSHIYQQVNRPFVAFATDVSSRLLTQAGTLLDDLARKAAGPEQARYRQDIQTLQAVQKSLPIAFGKRIANKFVQFMAGEELSEKETLNAQPEELSKEITRTVDCLTNHVAESLWHLNMRLALLRGGSKTADYSNPMSPAQFCGALCAELGKQSASARLQLLLFRLIEKHLPDRLAVQYDDANRQLVEAGVFPHLRYYLIENNAGSAAGPSSAFDVDALTSAAASERESQIHLAAMIRTQVNARESALRHTALGTPFGRMDTEGRGGADTFTEIDITFAIVALTTRYPVPRGRVYRPVPPIAELELQVLEQLLKSGEHTGRRRMKRLMAESFSRMGGIFNALLEDHYLGAEQRDLIGHLYLPMLKLGMLDGRFWTDPHHVGRRLFGVFCELAEFWVSAAQGDRTTYPQLHRAAECLTRDYIDDIAVVEAVFDELEAFAARIGQRANLTLNRTVEAERGMAKVGSAQTFAAEQAATMLSDEALPAVIRDSMQLPLTEFLSGLLLRYQSESGEKALAATGAIMAKALPKGDTPPQQGLADVSHDLMTAGGHTAAVQALVDAVQQALQRWQGLEGLSGKQAQAAVLAHGRKSSGAGPLAGLPGQGFGLWFAVEEREQPTPRLWLLVWASPAPRRYLFVNRLGVRGDMLDEGALREALDQGRLRPLVGHGNSWVRALRQAASQPGQ